MVTAPDAWGWSSYRYMSAGTDAPPLLEVDLLLAKFAPTRSEALTTYRAFVSSAIARESPLNHAKHQLFLGDDGFVSRVSGPPPDNLMNVARTHRRATAKLLADYFAPQIRRADGDR